MNPKGVTTKGLWIKVFVKALPNTADSLTDKFLFTIQLNKQKKYGQPLGLSIFL